MRISVLIVFVVLLLSCAKKFHLAKNSEANVFLNQVKSCVASFNDANGKKIFISDKYNLVEKIFESLKDSLVGPDIVFVFNWINHLPSVGTHDFEAILYDVSSQTTYYCFNTTAHPKKINYNFTKGHKSGAFILETYLKGKIDSLVQLPPHSSEGWDTFYVVNVNGEKDCQAYVLDGFNPMPLYMQ